MPLMSFAAATLVTVALGLPPIMPVKDVRRGQQGECQTVFEGATVEPFAFVVKGVMPDFLGPGRDLVLVRLQGDKPEFTGVVAGMSGSPCSIDGKLLGALAYAFASFAKEPIAGITPIEPMLDVMRLPVEPLPWRLAGAGRAGGGSGGAARAGRRASSDGRGALGAGAGRPAREQFAQALSLAPGAAPLPSTGAAVGAADAAGVAGTDHMMLQPIATPLSVSGMPPSLLREFQPWFDQAGFVVTMGATSGTGFGAAAGPAAGAGAAGAARAKGPKPDAPNHLEPGGAVMAVMVRGDVNVAATGTVTTVEGNEVLAFGHPFQGAGAVSIPMASAEIVNTMASALRSFKMSAQGQVLGELTQDRLTAIGGYLGQEPTMVQVRGSVRTKHRTEPFAFEIARDWHLTPRLTAMALAGALGRRTDAGQRGTVRLQGTIRMGDLEPVVVKQVYAAERDGRLMIYAALDMARAFSLLWNTPFAPPDQVSLEVDAVLDAEPQQEWIETMRVDRQTVRAGESIEVVVGTRRFQGDTDSVRFQVPVPRSWAGENIVIMAGGVDAAEGTVAAAGGEPHPTTVEEIATWLRQRRSDGYVYLMVVREGLGLHAGVDMLPLLPPSVVAVVGEGPALGVMNQAIAHEARLARPGTVAGSARQTIYVEPDIR